MRGLPVFGGPPYAERMTTPVALLLRHLPALNDPAAPYLFEVAGTTIVGSWDVVHTEYLELAEASSVDAKYRIIVELDEKKGCYEFTERAKGGGATATVAPALTYSFATSRITEPLFSFLEANGYSRKKGFFAGLFAR
jgi:hypothetical protein